MTLPMARQWRRWMDWANVQRPRELDSALVVKSPGMVNTALEVRVST